MISSTEQLALFEICTKHFRAEQSSQIESNLTPCKMPSEPAARTRFISPSGCPSLASAAGAINMGNELGSPNIVDEVDIFDILFNLPLWLVEKVTRTSSSYTRGRNQNRLNAS